MKTHLSRCGGDPARDMMLSPWHREWALLLAAVQALTQLPVPAVYDADMLRRSVRYMPVAGLLVGIVAAGVFSAARAGLPGMAAAALSLAATLLLTGALHEDGLADSVDGLFGGRSREEALRIMRDSRVGAFGVLGLIVVVVAKLACLAALPGAAGPLIAAHAASRFYAVAPPAVLPYARADGMAGALVQPDIADLAIAALCGLLPLLLLGPRAGPALLVSAAAALSFGLYVRRRLGGYTGDVLGAMQQLTELSVLLAALWRAG